MTDLDLDAPVAMSRRDVLKEARRHLQGVVVYALDAGLTPDKIDCENIREAARLVELALKETTAEQLARFGVVG